MKKGPLNREDPAKSVDGLDEIEKKCQKDADLDKFCFKFEEDLDINQDEPPKSEYMFGNKKWYDKFVPDELALQTRKVSEHPTGVLTPEQVMQNCEFYCTEELGGMLTFEEPPVVSAICSNPQPIPTYEVCTTVDSNA